MNERIESYIAKPTAMDNQMTEYRTVNTRDALLGPLGTRYVHDAARPFAVLRNTGKQEICVRRYSTEKAAKAFIRMRALWH